MNDLISRQAAINVTWEETIYTDPLNVLTDVREKIKALPSAQPEQRWIPCSERLPDGRDYDDEYLVTQNGGRIRMCFRDNGHWATSEEELTLKDEDVIAWQPLPPAFEGG